MAESPGTWPVARRLSVVPMAFVQVGGRVRSEADGPEPAALRGLPSGQTPPPRPMPGPTVLLDVHHDASNIVFRPAVEGRVDDGLGSRLWIIVLL